MASFNLKKFIPHIAAVVIFYILSLVYFYPVLEGYKLNQGDIEKHKSMAHEIGSHKEKYDETAFWAGNMFAGMPTYLTAKVKFDGNVIKYLQSVIRGGLPHPASALFAYLIGFFILLLCLRINPWLSLVGAIAFAFSSYFIIIIEAGHTSKTYALAYMAPILGGFIETLRGRKSVGALLISVFVASQLYVNHLQISYYLFFVLLFVGVGELINAIKEKHLVDFSKRMGIVLIAAFLGILPNLGNLMMTLEYSKQSTRGKTDLTINPGGEANTNTVSSGLDKDYITQWSYGLDETFTLLIPDAKGGKSIPILGDPEEIDRLKKEDPQFFNVLVSEYQTKNNAVTKYFGNQPIVSGPVYIGVIILALAFLALLFVRDRLVWALLSVTVLTVGLSWGKNFMGLTEFFIDYIPGYNKFRAVAMILVVAEFTIPILAILFVSKLIKEREVLLKEKKKFFIALGVIGGFLLLFALSPSTFVELSSDKELNSISATGQKSGAALVNQNAIENYRSDVVSASAWRSLQFFVIGSILLLLFLFQKIKKEILVLGLGCLVLVDLWAVDKRYLNNKEAGKQSTSGTKYESWLKPNKQLIPYEPSQIDQAILQNELKKKPELAQLIQQRIQEYKAESGERVDSRKMFDLQFAELMDQTHYRVLNTSARLDQDVKTPYFHKTLGGYHGAKMKKYQELVDFYLAVEHYRVRQTFAQGGAAYVQQLLPSLAITNLLNATYIVGPDNTGKAPEALLVNPYANGNAWFVENVVVKENADSAMLALGNYDLKKNVVIEEADLENLESFSAAESYTVGNSSIALADYDPNRLTYNYNTSSKQFVVFSEIFYQPGWEAYVNGERVEFTKVDYVLRGMPLAKGSGTIEFVFSPNSAKIGQTLIWISTIIFIGFLIFIGYEIRRDYKD